MKCGNPLKFAHSLDFLLLSQCNLFQQTQRTEHLKYLKYTISSLQLIGTLMTDCGHQSLAESGPVSTDIWGTHKAQLQPLSNCCSVRKSQAVSCFPYLLSLMLLPPSLSPLLNYMEGKVVVNNVSCPKDVQPNVPGTDHPAFLAIVAGRQLVFMKLSTTCCSRMFKANVSVRISQVMLSKQTTQHSQRLKAIKVYTLLTLYTQSRWVEGSAPQTQADR